MDSIGSLQKILHGFLKKSLELKQTLVKYLNQFLEKIIKKNHKVKPAITCLKVTRNSKKSIFLEILILLSF